MTKNRFTDEQIVGMLREADRSSVAEVTDYCAHIPLDKARPGILPWSKV